MNFMQEQVQDQPHQIEFMELIKNLDLTSFKISKNKVLNAQCCARVGRTGNQCTRKSKTGVDFCGFHGASDEPKRCAKCSKKGTDVFHANKWEHFGRMGEPAPVRTVKRVVKNKKDPSKPKRGLNKYMSFTKAMRAGVATAHPEMSPKDVSRELGQQWRAMSDEDKAPYIEMAKQNKEVSEKALAVWETEQKAKAVAEAAVAEAAVAETVEAAVADIVETVVATVVGTEALNKADDSMPGNERVLAMLPHRLLE